MVVAATQNRPYLRDWMTLSAAPQAITVDLDLTFVVVLVAFVALTLFLKPVLFDPMIRLFEERERRIDGAKLEARRIDEKSVKALTEYETAMAKARATAHTERDKLRAEGLKREKEILDGVRATTSKTIDDGKRAVHAEAEKVRASLKADATTMARDLASRVLGREVQP
jgi:F-type H+-transporting ATPase subunit b